MLFLAIVNKHDTFFLFQLCGPLCNEPTCGVIMLKESVLIPHLFLFPGTHDGGLRLFFELDFFADGRRLRIFFFYLFKALPKTAAGVFSLVFYCHPVGNSATVAVVCLSYKVHIGVFVPLVAQSDGLFIPTEFFGFEVGDCMKYMIACKVQSGKGVVVCHSLYLTFLMFPPNLNGFDFFYFCVFS